MFYIDPDGRTVHEARVATNGILLENGNLVADRDIGNRIFAVHPDNNTYMRKEEDGTYSFQDPLSKRTKGTERRYFRPQPMETT